jgi:hypothetical protein
MVKIETRDMAKILTERLAKMDEALAPLKAANIPVEVLLLLGQIRTEDKLILDYANELIAADDAKKAGPAKPAAKPAPAPGPKPLSLGPPPSGVPAKKSDAGKLAKSEVQKQNAAILEAIQLAGVKGFCIAELVTNTGIDGKTVSNRVNTLFNMKNSVLDRYNSPKNPDVWTYRMKNAGERIVTSSTGGRDSK